MIIKKLATYHAKRDFKKTSEPKGENKSIGGDTFVIQKHNASHLHYDLRLEVNGVLKSWAVPKGVPRSYDQKHLAIETEDHPIEYAKFEGTIPKGEYGGGTVKIWDSGKYEHIISPNKPQKTMLAALKDGSLKFKLNGNKYKGTYAMVRFKQENNKNQWLIYRVLKHV